MPRLAAFVTPHGFGHAARASAVLAALARRVPGLELELWTTVPEWFFAASLPVPFRYRPCACDVGVVQSDAVTEDLPATVAALEALWGGHPETEDFLFRGSSGGRGGWRSSGAGSAEVASEAKGFLFKEVSGGRGGSRSSGAGSAEVALEAKDLLFRGLGAELRDSGAVAVLCDISPVGLVAARWAGLPSVLVENFTWDWIYEGLVAAEPRLGPWVARLRPVSAGATLRLQAEPVCGPSPAAGADVRPIPPVARSAKLGAAEVRSRLGIAAGRAMVLVSLGGIHSPAALRPVVERARLEAVDFVVPGGAEREERRGNLLLLPHRTPVYHPDLVAAADVVVGKLGYSTVAEAFAAGTRFAYLPRPAFRESAVLERFVGSRLPAIALAPEEFASGAWVERLPELLARPRPAPGAASGAEQAAAAIAELL